MQKHWIGRSTGAEVTFKVKDSDLKFDVFTTRADTLNGVTYVVLAPENKLVDKLTTAENKEAVENYKETAAKQSEIERQQFQKKKNRCIYWLLCNKPYKRKRSSNMDFRLCISYIWYWSSYGSSSSR